MPSMYLLGLSIFSTTKAVAAAKMRMKKTISISFFPRIYCYFFFPLYQGGVEIRYTTIENTV